MFAISQLDFIEYMTNDKGEVTNFISNSGGKVVDGVKSSYYGGSYWSARAKWALTKAYSVLKDMKYFNLFKKIKIEGTFENDVYAILLLAELELGKAMNRNLISKYSEVIVNLMNNGYFLHKLRKEIHICGVITNLKPSSRLTQYLKIRNSSMPVYLL